LSDWQQLPIGAEYVSGEPIWQPATCEGRGLAAYFLPASSEGRGRNRGIEDNSLRGFLLWVGEGEDPDLTASPDVTGASLPLAYEPDGDGTYHTVLMRRNGYGVVSGATPATVTRIVGGVVVAPPPGPLEALAAVVRGWRLTARAVYLSQPGASDPTAIGFEVRQLVTGDDPDTQDGTVAVNVQVDGTGVATFAVTLDDDLTGFSGSVEVEAWAIRGADVGPSTIITVAAPGAEVAAVPGVLTETETGVSFYHPEE
jgi:hypothetical protein